MITGDGEKGCTDDDDTFSKYEALASSLPASSKGIGTFQYRNYEGFWYPEHLLVLTLAVRDTFIARPTDIVLATMPKSGTTWLKALVYCVVHRGHHRHAPTAPEEEEEEERRHHPLLASSPHDVVPFLHSIYENHHVHHLQVLHEMPSPRILAVHAPFTALPASVRESSAAACPRPRVVYLCRDPKDAFVSLRHYLDEINKGSGSSGMTPFAEAFDLFCAGVSPFGPVWDHMAEYWKESVARPEEVMFLRYEDLKEDAVGSVTRLAAFLGRPFSDEEAERGVPAEIVALCSMDRMRSVLANRDGVHRNARSWFKNSAFFRKGEVGDWKAHMTLEMARKLDGIMEEKLRGIDGLSP